MKDRRQKTYFLFKILVILLFLIITFSSCVSLNISPELDKHFSTKQIKDLNKINDFFLDQYLNNNSKDFSKSFKEMFNKINIYGIDTLIDQVNYNKQTKLYNSISKTFDEIWEIRENTDVEFSSMEYIVPKSQGKFQLFLKELSKTNSLALDSYKNIEASGDYNYMMFFFYIKDNFNSIDFKDFNNQLIISIYYLSMVDDNERDERIKKRRKEIQKKVKNQLNN